MLTVNTMQAPAETPTPVTVARTIPESAKEGLAKWMEESKKAKVVVREWLDGPHTEVTEELVHALDILFPKKSKKGTAGTRGQEAICDKFAKFLADGPKDLMAIFKEFKMGEGEVRVRIKELIQKRSGEARVWVRHNEDNDTYEIVARGDEIPAGWKGPFPKAGK